MLKLTRKQYESVTLVMPDGRPITVRLERVSRNAPKAQISFDAPDDVKIYRSEILEAPAEGGGR